MYDEAKCVKLQLYLHTKDNPPCKCLQFFQSCRYFKMIFSPLYTSQHNFLEFRFCLFFFFFTRVDPTEHGPECCWKLFWLWFLINFWYSHYQENADELFSSEGVYWTLIIAMVFIAWAWLQIGQSKLNSFPPYFAHKNVGMLKHLHVEESYFERLAQLPAVLCSLSE